MKDEKFNGNEGWFDPRPGDDFDDDLGRPYDQPRQKESDDGRIKSLTEKTRLDPLESDISDNTENRPGAPSPPKSCGD